MTREIVPSVTTGEKRQQVIVVIGHTSTDIGELSSVTHSATDHSKLIEPNICAQNGWALERTGMKDMVSGPRSFIKRGDEREYAGKMANKPV